MATSERTGPAAPRGRARGGSAARGKPRRITGRGGARPGAGRPAKGPQPSEPHVTRPFLAARHPVHITVRVARGVGRLQRRRCYVAIRRAVRTALGRTDFRIIDLDVRTNRLELLVEADDRMALARGMQGFQIACARHLNRALRRRGLVFPDRYRAAILFTRRLVRRAVAALPGRERACTPHTWLLRIDAPPRSRHGGLQPMMVASAVVHRTLDSSRAGVMKTLIV